MNDLVDDIWADICALDDPDAPSENQLRAIIVTRLIAKGQQVDAAPMVENTEVQDAAGGPKRIAHRVIATTLENGETEMTVFIGGGSAQRALDYARLRYVRSAAVVMHCDPAQIGAAAGMAELGKGQG